MGSILNDAPIPHYVRVVCIADSGQTVSDHQARAVLGQVVDALANALFRFVIE